MPSREVAPVQQATEHRPSPKVRTVWPIGALLAVHWVAHHAGPQPDAVAVIEVVELGLLELGDEWRATERGLAALHEHGWL
jgi:hypothetical protein